ncbi:MAG TPA: DUF1064 domain-containing protein [Porticoccus sp.]|nr:DUF1064 domain-containing protein [Porticoccus sp.]
MARVVRYNKYGAKKVTIDNIRFDSKLEAKRYGELKLMHAAGAITHLQMQPVFFIAIKGNNVCRVILDFKYLQHTVTWVYEDCKGYDTPISRLKRKLVEAQYGIKVSVVKGK